MSMSTDGSIENLPPVDTDDDEDLTTLDRGDEVVEDEVDEDTEDSGKPRDDKGRFTKKDDKAEDDTAEESEDEVEDEEEAEDDEDEEAPEGEGKSGKVDNAALRLNKMKKQRDDARAAAAAVEARLAELEKLVKKDAPAEKHDPVAEINTQLDDLYEQVEDARADNRLKDAAALQRKIDTLNRDLVKIEATQIANKTTSVAAENARYDVMLDKLEQDFPELDPKSDDYDKGAVEALEFHVAAYEKMGMLPTKALATASRLLFGTPASKQPAPEAKPEPKKKVDAKKAIDTQKRQPPDASALGVNKDETSIKAGELSEEDFDKLPETKKAQLRGDFG